MLSAGWASSLKNSQIPISRPDPSFYNGRLCMTLRIRSRSSLNRWALSKIRLLSEDYHGFYSINQATDLVNGYTFAGLFGALR